MQHLPSFRALQSLEIALREGSVSAAARKLNVTPGAVSRQLSALEAEMGVPLLSRHGRGISGTAKGRMLAERLTMAFGEIRRAVMEVRADDVGRPLTFNVFPSMAIHWLVPLLPDFQGLHPRIDLRLRTSAAPDRFDRNDIDVAISIGPWPDPRMRNVPLFARRFSPVCSPATRNGYGPDLTPEALHTARIFYSEMQIESWNLWTEAAGIRPLDLTRNGLRLENTSLAYQAAREGAGFAIGQPTLLRGELESTRMVMPFQETVSSEQDYCVVYRRVDEGAASLRALVEWLLSKVDRDDAAQRNRAGQEAAR